MFFKRFIILSIAVASALLLSQFPSFERLYETRMQARLDELKRQLYLFEQAAIATGYELEEYISFFQGQEIEEFSQAGNVMAQSLERKDALEETYNKLKQAHGVDKILVWLQNFDLGLTRDSWQHYHYLIGLDATSLGFAASGFILGSAFGYLLCALTKALFNFLWSHLLSLLKRVVSFFRSLFTWRSR